MSCIHYNKYNILSIDNMTETSSTSKIESMELEHSTITILKRKKKQWTKSSSTPMTILPEKVDTSKASPRNWMNTVDPWTSQWIKKVVDQDDLITVTSKTLSIFTLIVMY